MSRHLPPIPLLLAFLLCACGDPAPPTLTPPAPEAPAPPTGDVLATVNGTAIREADLTLAAARAGHGGSEAPVTSQLEEVIRQELAAQQAAALGLDKDRTYQARLAPLQAAVDAFRRRSLSDAYYAHQISAAGPTDDEARQYFAAHKDELRTELHVEQILTKDESEILKARQALAEGTPFEKVAAERFRGLPASVGTPWDLGYLRWSQVPEAWRTVLAGMSKGDVSDVIRGPAGRFWIIRLLDSRVGADITFEEVKPQVISALTRDRVDAVREESAAQLRAQAVILYNPSPPTPLLGGDDDPETPSASDPP